MRSHLDKRAPAEQKRLHTEKETKSNPSPSARFLRLSSPPTQAAAFYLRDFFPGSSVSWGPILGEEILGKSWLFFDQGGNQTTVGCSAQECFGGVLLLTEHNNALCMWAENDLCNN